MIYFDNAPIFYWLIGYFLSGLLLFYALFKTLSTKLFLLLSVLLVVYMRLPVVIFNEELNPDESQMLSHAITLAQDPVYWRSVDGTTIGPLDNYLLVAPHLFGFQIDYTSGRVMGLFCICNALLFLFFALKNWFGDQQARTMFLVPIIFLAFTQETDFVHYSSEQLPFLLLSIQIWLLSLLSTRTLNFSRSLYFLGFIAGSIPFAKLQGVPIAMVLTFASIWIWYRRDKSYKALISLFAGCLTFPLVVFACVTYYGLLSDVIDFYLFSNLMYTEGNSSRSMIGRFLAILDLSFDFKVFTGILLLTFVGVIIKIMRGAGKPQNNGSLFMPVVLFFLAFASIYAVTKSGKDFVHYLYFCIPAWTLLAACFTVNLGKWNLLFPCLILLVFFINDFLGYRRELRFNNYASEYPSKPSHSPVIRELKKYTSDGDYLVVWGWNCGYYVQAQLAHGTAENHSERSIVESVLLDRYRDRYISDIKRTKPTVFLDATGKNSLWLQNRVIHGHHTFLELRDYIRTHYRYMGDFDGTRMYLRKI